MNTPLKKTLKKLKFAHTHLVTCQMWSHLHTVTSNNPIPLPLLPQHTHLCVTNQNSVSLFTIPPPSRSVCSAVFFATSGVCLLLPAVCDSTTQRPPSPKTRPIDDSKPKPGTQSTPRAPVTPAHTTSTSTSTSPDRARSHLATVDEQHAGQKRVQ